MRIAALLSGGKDSVYATYKACKSNELVCVIAIKSRNPHSYMFHTPNIGLVEFQANAIGVPLILEETEGVKEEELKDLKKAIESAKEKYDIEGVVSGAVGSNYQKQRIESICKELKLKSLTPLWHINTEIYLRELVRDCEIIITGIAADGLNKEFLGMRIGLEFDERMKHLNVNPVGEGGEFETFVLDCPLFKKKLVIEEAEKKTESECCGVYTIKKIKLTKK